MRWLFPALLFPGAFVAVAWFGLFQNTGDPVRLFFLVFAALGFFWFLVKGFSSLRASWSQSADRRVETDNELILGSLAALRDDPLLVSRKKSLVLWQEHQQRLETDLGQLRARLWHSVWAKIDVFGLRALVVLMLFSGFVIAGNNAQERLSLALYPGLLLGPEADVTVEAWINPPQYTKLPPIFLPVQSVGDNLPIEVLEGSEFVVRVSHSRRAPTVSVNTKTRKKTKLTKLSDGVFEAKLVLNEIGTIQLSRGASGVWDLRKKPDLPPQIAFDGQPETNEKDELQFKLIAHDDFAVEQVWLLIETIAEGNFPKTDRVQLLLPKSKNLDQTLELDFTRHLFAGLPVQLQLEAIDAAGQITISSFRDTVLPEKLLIKPLAKAIAEQRLLIMRETSPYLTSQASIDEPFFIGEDKLFTESPMERLRRAPAKVQRSAALMRSVMRAPQVGGVDDLFVWLGLAYVSERLQKAKSQENLAGLDVEMWEIMLRAEGGELESALAAMRLAEKALQNALLLSAPASELQRLSQKYEMAVKRYLQALAKAALQGENPEQGGAASAMSGDQLQEMLDALQALAETGATKDARTLLKALTALLQNMKMQLGASGQGGGQESIVAEAMRKALEELGELLGKQREILDRTQQQSNEGTAESGLGQGQQPSTAFDELAAEQGTTLDQLKSLKDSGVLLGDEADLALKRAQNAMEAAKGALAQADGDQALGAGQEAFGELRSGAEALAQEMLDVLEEGSKGNRDAFGRQNNQGEQSGEGTLIPELIYPERAREILQELRRRARDKQRPAEELEYLDRLLERF